MTANRIWIKLECHTGVDLRYLTEVEYKTIKTERDDFIKTIEDLLRKADPYHMGDDPFSGTSRYDARALLRRAKGEYEKG